MTRAPGAGLPGLRAVIAASYVVSALVCALAMTSRGARRTPEARTA